MLLHDNQWWRHGHKGLATLLDSWTKQRWNRGTISERVNYSFYSAYQNLNTTMPGYEQSHMDDEYVEIEYHE